MQFYSIFSFSIHYRLLEYRGAIMQSSLSAKTKITKSFFSVMTVLFTLYTSTQN
ncbi:hypothetical protein A343_2411 [Porphyromonas gingivalis JCVI SC001]|nr:hypothetical protein A343_2411 [Porphyromonas gingivalis JCVI SC001]ERJ66001.1 hypothetical protein HMPREF1553_01966 [Porphyromonas gingivalis F0568]